MAAKKKTEEESRRDRLAAISKVAARFEGFKPAGEVLTKVKAVPTIFPQVNCATRCGGWPIERIGLIHGRSTEGKTSFCLGLGKSFLERDHLFAYVDAEHATPSGFISLLLGEHANHPGFMAIRPESYEQTRDSVRDFCEKIGLAKEKGELPPDTTALIVIDSIRKLFPKRMIDALEKEAEKVGVDGLRGMAGAYKAALNAAFMDEAVPLLYHTGTAMVIIARERKRMNAAPFQTPWEVSGGESLLYESSLACRMSREWVKEGDEITGERIQCQIYKSKVGGKEGKNSLAFFHTNAQGFDRARDVLEMALATGLICKKHGKHSVEMDLGPLGAGEVFGNSEAEALAYLRANRGATEAIEEAAVAKFNPTEVEGDPT